MNSKIIKLDEEIKDLNNKIFEQALKRSENIFDTTDKILIQSALRNAIILNKSNFNLNKLVNNYLYKYKYLHQIYDFDQILYKLNNSQMYLK